MQVDSIQKNAPEAAKTLRTAGGQAALAVVVLALGLGTTAWVARSQARQETLRAEREFQQAADKLFARTLREIQLFMEVLDSIRQLHSLSDQVSAEAFDEIVRKGMIYQRRILGAYGFAQRIPHDLRADYEGQAGKPRSIAKADGKGGFDPAPHRAEYFPLTYQTPPGGLGVPEGYDFGARSEDRAAIAAMRQMGVFALGGSPAGMAAGGDGHGEIYMFAPILYSTGVVGQELVGFAVGLFHPRRVLATAMGDRPLGLVARLEAAAGGASPDGIFHFERDFSLANQEWRFVAEADPAFWAAARSRAPEAMAAAGAAISLALAGALLWMAGRARRIEALVGKRTAELAEANRKLEAAMEDRRELEDEVLRIGGHEKARIGRDLHDSLGQKLTGAMYLFGAYRQRIGKADAAADADAAQIASTLKDSVSQVRRIARGLAPVALTEDGLPDALRRLAEESSALFRKTVEFYAEREGKPKDAGTAEHLYLIAQEAVNNAAKHGEAERIVLALDYDDRGGILTVEDNGRGLSASRQPDREGGNGLRIMRHRAEVFGGELVVETGPQGGVRVRCRFPSAGSPEHP
ncbi:MAG: histidine kinase [Kiritimatiellia bacterium]